MVEYDVFISYHTMDKPIVRELVKKLRDRDPKLRVWVDEERIDAGDSIQDKLEEGIEYSRTAVVLVGKDGLGPWEKREVKALLQYAVNKDKRIIPVLLPSTYEDPKLPLFLRDCRYVNLKQGLDTIGFEELLRGITKDRPRSKPDSPFVNTDELAVKPGVPVDPVRGNPNVAVIYQKPSSPEFTVAKPHFFNFTNLRLVLWLAAALVLLALPLAIYLNASKNPATGDPINSNNRSSENKNHWVVLNVDPEDTELSININGGPYKGCDKPPCRFLAPLGSSVIWKAKHEGYNSKNGSLIVNVENTRDIILEKIE